MKFLDLTKVYIRSGSWAVRSVFAAKNSLNMAARWGRRRQWRIGLGRGGRGVEHPDRFSLSTTLFRGQWTPGMGSQRSRNGEDKVLYVPVGLKLTKIRKH